MGYNKLYLIVIKILSFSKIKTITKCLNACLSLLFIILPHLMFVKFFLFFLPYMYVFLL